jgi:uncharacterized Ntn-hydrolase superfamily protein
MRAVKTITPVLFAALAAACQADPGYEYLSKLEMTTWSVAAIDPVTGDVSVASASCVPSHADALASLVPGKGAAATQASFDLKNRNVVYQAIQEGLTAEQVIARVTDPANDTNTNSRQYGVVTLNNGVVHVAGFTAPSRLGTTARTTGGRGGAPATPPPAGTAAQQWAGVKADASMGVTVQGNTLASEDVVGKGLEAFQWTDPTGFNSLTDRVMRALEAGAVWGGDVRCNNSGTETANNIRPGTRQTAAMAFIVAARGTDAPYAADSIGMSDQGTEKSPWLSISIRAERGGDNPLLELRLRYDRWRRGVDHSAPGWR